VEGGSSKDFREAKKLMYGQPDVMHKLLDRLADAVIDYLNGQIRAGAQVVQIFDTWGGVLTTWAYEEFSLKYMRKIIAGLNLESEGRRVPVIVFTKTAASGWRPSQTVAPTLWAWIGPRTLATLAPELATKWCYRAIWTRPCCTRRPRAFAKKWAIFCAALAMVRATSLIWATALHRM
jgi:hypothetical protein